MTRSLLLAVLMPATQAFAADAPKQRLDLRFHFEGRTYHTIAPIQEGVDLDLRTPLQSDDKSKTVNLRLRASLQDADAYGRSTLFYDMSLHGLDDVLLLESRASIYLRPGTYSKIADCGGWDFNLGLMSKDKSGLRTDDDLITVTAKGSQGDQKCQLHVKPGGNGELAAELLDDQGRPRRYSFKLSPSDEAKLGGAFDIGYEFSFPGYAMQGVVSLAPRHGQSIKKDGRSAYVWLSQDD